MSKPIYSYRYDSNSKSPEVSLIDEWNMMEFLNVIINVIILNVII